MPMNVQRYWVYVYYIADKKLHCTHQKLLPLALALVEITILITALLQLLFWYIILSLTLDETIWHLH